jgi:hypothetical protein
MPIEAPSPFGLLSSDASLPICLSFTGWLSCHLLSCASTLCHLLLRSHLTCPSLTPPLRSCQLVVASKIFAPPPPLDVPPPRYWLCRRCRLRHPSKPSLSLYDTIAIIVDFVACHVVAIIDMVIIFLKCMCVHLHTKNLVNT